MQVDMHGSRPSSDFDIDGIIELYKRDIMKTTSLNYVEESWITSHFTSEQIGQCTLSVTEMPRAITKPGMDVADTIKVVQDWIMRLVTNDHSWPFGHTGLVAWRAQWDQEDFTGHVWILSSSTEIMRRVKLTFDHEWVRGWQTQLKPLRVMLSPRPFIFRGTKGHSGILIGPSGSPGDIVWSGADAWSGLNALSSQSGFMEFSPEVKGMWEKFIYETVTAQGMNAEALMGAPQFQDYWIIIPEFTK